MLDNISVISFALRLQACHKTGLNIKQQIIRRINLNVAACAAPAAEEPATTEGTEAPDTTEGNEATTEGTEAPAIKVGFIMLHDENSTYDLNFINAAKEACATLGIPEENYVIKTNVPEGQECYNTAA